MRADDVRPARGALFEIGDLAAFVAEALPIATRRGNPSTGDYRVIDARGVRKGVFAAGRFVIKYAESKPVRSNRVSRARVRARLDNYPPCGKRPRDSNEIFTELR
jgi:hypothetical protein